MHVLKTITDELVHKFTGLIEDFIWYTRKPNIHTEVLIRQKKDVLKHYLISMNFVLK